MMRIIMAESTGMDVLISRRVPAIMSTISMSLVETATQSINTAVPHKSDGFPLSRTNPAIIFVMPGIRSPTKVLSRLKPKTMIRSPMFTQFLRKSRRSGIPIERRGSGL